MWIAIVKSTGVRIRSILRSAALRHFATGAFASVCAVVLVHRFVATFGASLPVLTAIVLAIAGGLQWGMHRRTRKHAPSVNLLGDALAPAALAAWTLCAPVLLMAAAALFSLVSDTMLAADAMATAMCTTAAVGILVAPFYWIGRLATEPQTSSSSGAQSRGASSFTGFCCGFAFGIVCETAFVAAIIGLPWSLGIASACLVALTAIRLKQIFKSADVDEELRAAVDAQSATLSREWRRSVTGFELIQACLFGAAMAVAMRFVTQLMPAYAPLVATQWAGLCLGAACGVAIWHASRNASRSPWHALSVSSLCGASWLMLLLLTFPWLIDLTLWFNANVSSVLLSLSLRCALLGALFAPLGCIWGWRAASTASGKRLTLHPAAFAVGCAAIWWFGFSNVTPARLCLAISVLLMCCAGTSIAIYIAGLRRMESATRSSQVGYAFRGLTAGALACVFAAGIWWSDRYRPDHSARLLFSSSVATAKLSGVESDMLPVLDEGRLVTTIEGDHSTYTIWKHRGAQLQIRENGIPRAVVSSNAKLCPQYVPEVIQAVLPMALHEKPHRVLLLGMPGAVGLEACLTFPVVSVRCFDSDPALTNYVSSTVWAQRPEGPFADERVHRLTVDPVLGIKSAGELFDVIVSTPEQSSLGRAAATYTTEFYRNCARRLAGDGILCQRFQQIDFGPEPLCVALNGFRSSFRHVSAVEIGYGEVLILGTNSESGLAREDLAKRLQAPQVRIALGRIGWDWCLPLDLETLNSDAIAELSSKWNSGWNTASNGRFTFRLPHEVLRWGPKPQQRNERFAAFSNRMLTWDADAREDADVLKRLSETVDERELMRDNPDQYWAYRKVVKEQLSKHPQTLIRQVSGELPRRELHPLEKRRVRYFEELGNALRQESPTTESIDRVAEFSFPYDPLLTYFVHEEVAQLHARTSATSRRAEFEERLYTVHYSDPNNRSVRNVIAAIECAVSDPNVVDNSADRWDHLNSLLQVLAGRWNNRRSVPPSSVAVALNDIEKSVTAVESAVAEMDGMRESAGVESAEWAARREYFDLALVRPLRSYRAQLQPHLAKEQVLRENAANGAVE